MRAIDVRYMGLEHVICCWQVDNVLIDPGPASSLEVLLDELGEQRPAALALTHIHLDHAGAAGALVRRWPQLEVWVHERGAPHLVDPSKLVASAKRLYGSDFDRLWGEVVPVPQQALKVLRDGEQVAGFDVAATPGHASHHVAFRHRDTGWAFVGDACGVRLPASSLVLPPTPPPDIDLEAWRRSLNSIEAWQPNVLALTHFGHYGDVAAHLAATRAALDRWGHYARTVGRDDYAAALRAAGRNAVCPEDAAAFDVVVPAEDWWLGLDRYWRGRARSSTTCT